MKRFLIINIFGIGDVLFTTPLIKNIRKNIPDAYIGYICNKRAISVLESNPNINKIFIYEKDDYRAIYKESRIRFLKEIIRSLKDIKKEEFDVVIDLSLNSYASFFMWLLGIPERIGFNYKKRSPLLTTKIEINGFENRHVVEHYLGILDLLEINTAYKELEVFTKDEDKEWADETLKKNGITSDGLLVGIIPGGGASWGSDARYRRWDPKNHAQIADKIIEKFQAKVILLGDSQEDDIGKKVIRSMKNPALYLIGKTTIGQYLSVLSRCHLVIMNDGGPLHMAVAAGTKTVSLIGPVDEHVYGPYPLNGHQVVTSSIDCRPCYRQFRRADCEHIGCLNQISVDDVFNKIENILTTC